MKHTEGSWNVYRGKSGGLVLEVETEGDWGPEIPLTLPELRQHMPVKAAVILAGRIVNEPGDSLLYGDNVEVDEVRGWTLEFSAVRETAVPV